MNKLRGKKERKERREKREARGGKPRSFVERKLTAALFAVRQRATVQPVNTVEAGGQIGMKLPDTGETVILQSMRMRR